MNEKINQFIRLEQSNQRLENIKSKKDKDVNRKRSLLNKWKEKRKDIRIGIGNYAHILTAIAIIGLVLIPNPIRQTIIDTIIATFLAVPSTKTDALWLAIIATVYTASLSVSAVCAGIVLITVPKSIKKVLSRKKRTRIVFNIDKRIENSEQEINSLNNELDAISGQERKNEEELDFILNDLTESIQVQPSKLKELLAKLDELGEKVPVENIDEGKFSSIPIEDKTHSDLNPSLDKILGE